MTKFYALGYISPEDTREDGSKPKHPSGSVNHLFFTREEAEAKLKAKTFRETDDDVWYIFETVAYAKMQPLPVDVIAMT